MNTTNTIALSGLALLAACNGPWNMEATEHDPDRSLWVSSTQVAGRSFDTIFIEETRPLSGTSKLWSTQDAGSRVAVLQDSSGVRDTVEFQPTTVANAWIPVAGQRGKLVRWNANLSLRASVVRNDGTRQDLSAESYTPANYSLSDTIWVPLEALHPRLSTGELRSAFAADPAGTAEILDPSGAFRRKWRLTAQDFANYASGRSVMRAARARGRDVDTIWFIFDRTQVSPLLAEIPAGGGTMSNHQVEANARQMIVQQSIDPVRFGGTVLWQGFDTTRARIKGPVFEQFANTFKFDTTSFFQLGRTRPWTVYPKYAMATLPGWPAGFLYSNTYIGYTGRNTTYSLAVDSLYYDIYRALTGETGDGQYSVTNIRGGRGFFTGGAIDSLSLDVESASPDTLSVPMLRERWCDSLRVWRSPVRKRNRGGDDTLTSITPSITQAVCGEAF